MVTCIIVEIPVTKKGQLNFFEVSIPKDVTLVFDTQATITRIRGIKDLNRLKGRNVAGAIKLQSENNADLYYCSLVTIGNSPVEALLPGLPDVCSDLVNLFVTPYYDNDYRSVPSLETIDSYTLYGCYEDLLGKDLNLPVSYSISLCLWIKYK